MYYSIALGLMLFVFLFGLQNQLIAMYTDDEDIVAQLTKVWPIVSTYAFLDCLNYIAGSGLRASGKQGLAAILTWLNYCGFGIGVSWILAFKTELGISGIWIGHTSVLFIMTIGYLIIWNCLDLNKIIEES